MSNLNKAFIRAYTQKQDDKTASKAPEAIDPIYRFDTQHDSASAPFWIMSITTLDAFSNAMPDATPDAQAPDSRSIQLHSFDETIVARIDPAHPTVRAPSERTFGTNGAPREFASAGKPPLAASIATKSSTARQDAMPASRPRPSEPPFAGLTSGLNEGPPVREKLSAYRERSRLLLEQIHTQHAASPSAPAEVPISDTDISDTDISDTESIARTTNDGSVDAPADEASTSPETSRETSRAAENAEHKSQHAFAPRLARDFSFSTATLPSASPLTNEPPSDRSFATMPAPKTPTPNTPTSPASPTQLPDVPSVTGESSEPTASESLHFESGSSEARPTEPDAAEAPFLTVEPVPTKVAGTDAVDSRSIETQPVIPDDAPPAAIASFNKIAKLLSEQAALEKLVSNIPSDSDMAISTTADSPTASTPLTESATSQSVSFQPAWEVDQLNWPEVTNQLCAAEQSTLDEVCKHLIDANQTGLQVLAITSLEAGHGGSTVAMCLARSVAKTGTRVALIDADPNGQSLADAFNLDVDHGWLDCIARDIGFEESAVQAIDDSVTLFPLSGLTAQSQLTLDSYRLQRVIEHLKKHFDFVVVDCQKLADRQCALVADGMGSVVDAAIIVTDDVETGSTGIESSVEQLHKCSIASVGLVENFIAK
jgi:Mrp family chromosome partitioning ATPase